MKVNKIQLTMSFNTRYLIVFYLLNYCLFSLLLFDKFFANQVALYQTKKQTNSAFDNMDNTPTQKRYK